MKIFGKTFFEKQEPMTVETGSSYTNFAFSTPLSEVGKGNLSLPYVNKYYTQNNIVRFGQDNLYPQLLNQLYLTSPMLGTCINFLTNASIGGGYSWVDEKVSAQQKIDQLTFEKVNKFPKLAKLLDRDYIIHNRVTVIVQKRSGAVKLKRVDPSTIRNGADLRTFVYSADWSKGMVDMKEYKRWTPECGEGEWLYVYQDETPGQDVYPIPQYNSILNWAYLDGESAFFHKANIQNSVFPSLVIRRPKEFQSVAEVDKFKKEISGKTGASSAGKVLVLTGNGMDQVPTLDVVSANSNDKVFEGTAKELKESIAISMGINPSIMGVKTAGQLGATTEIKDSYAICEKNVVKPIRETMTEILNELVEICKIKNNIIINEYQIVDGIVTDTTDAKSFVFEPKNK
jgi:hypothetical protein